MIRRVAFRPEATAEIAEAVDWYETHGKGLGSEFLRSLEAIVANVERNPLAFPLVRGNTRRALLRRFPYALMYKVSDEQLLIVACFHSHRDPQHWQSRM